MMKEPSLKEPSVLDYLKSLLSPWKGERIPFPGAEGPEAAASEEVTRIVGPEIVGETPTIVQVSPVDESELRAGLGLPALPWRALAALLLALMAQSAFAPLERSADSGIILLLAAAALIAWSALSGELTLTPYPAHDIKKDNLRVRVPSLVIGALLAALTFWACGGGKFTPLNLSLLGASLVFLLHAFWQGRPATLSRASKIARWVNDPEWRVRLSRWSLLVLAAALLVLFFRLYQLDAVPPEMVSDHAEKYLDAGDILNGETRIFFARNGGREALQFYLLAALMRYFGAPPTFLTLKISTVLVGLLALPYLYLLGKEVGNRRVALIVFTFAGIAYWTNVVARAGMRLPFYMLFSAVILYHLLRGMRTGERNQYILAGIFLGLSFYGYSANRLLPLVVAVGVGLFLVHRQSRGHRTQTTWHTALLALMAFVVFLPLLRYILLDPSGFSQRMISRMSGTEQPLPGPAYVIFLDNLWRALRMFSWTAGVVWGVSIPDYPALGVVAGGLFYLGVALALLRYLREQHWLDLFLLLAIPLLMLPSILSLAFPAENPNLYRTGGAMVPVFLLVGLALDSLMNSLEARLRHPWGARLAWGLLALLLAWSALQDYELVFHTYEQQYRQSAWNYSEMGTVIHSFSETIGSPDTAWVMGYPHWADTRLVAIEAGYPQRDYAMFVDGLENTLADPRPKLFLVNLQDQDARQALPQFYPEGWFQTYESSVESKDFLLFFAPPSDE